AIGVFCGIFAPLGRVVQRVLNILQNAPPIYSMFPELERPWFVAFALELPAWALTPLIYGGYFIWCSMGLCTALVVRPRNREGDIVCGIGTGLIAGAAALGLGGLGWQFNMNFLTAQHYFSDLDLLAEKSAAQRWTAEYPQLTYLSPSEQANYLHYK